MTSYYEQIHKWPKGFKKKLCIFYNQRNLEIFGYKGHLTIYRCALCGSTNNVSIHCHKYHRRIPAQYINIETETIDWDDMSKYIPLCNQCHGKIETQYGEEFSKGASPHLQFFWWYMEKIHPNGYWNFFREDEIDEESR